MTTDEPAVTISSTPAPPGWAVALITADLVQHFPVPMFVTTLDTDGFVQAVPMITQDDVLRPAAQVARSWGGDAWLLGPDDRAPDQSEIREVQQRLIRQRDRAMEATRRTVAVGTMDHPGGPIPEAHRATQPVDSTQLADNSGTGGAEPGGAPDLSQQAGREG